MSPLSDKRDVRTKKPHSSASAVNASKVGTGLKLGEDLFLNRSPIIDREWRIFAYQLDFLTARETNIGVYWDRLDPSLLALALDSTDPLTLTDGRPGFAKINLKAVDGLVIRDRWDQKIILEIGDPAAKAEIIVNPLKSVRFCVSELVFARDRNLEVLFSSPGFAKIHAGNRGKPELYQTLAALKGLPVSTIATGVSTKEDFDIAFEAGFDLFHGEFLRTGSAGAGRAISRSQAALLDLWEHTAGDEEIAVVEGIFRKDPKVNSALRRAFGSHGSIRQAISVLGHENLRKWAALMLFTIDHPNPSSDPLYENALVRARAMELIAGQLEARGLNGAAYMTGLFSLVPGLFDLPIEEFMSGRRVDEEIRKALVTRDGNLGAVLNVVEEFERGWYEKCGRRAEKLGIGMKGLLAAETTAIIECPAWRSLRPILSDLRPEAMDSRPLRRVKFGELLVQQELITEDQLAQALAFQKRHIAYKPLGEVCVELGFISRTTLREVLVKYYKQIRLGDLLVNMGVVSQSQVVEALHAQRESGKKLGQVLIEKGFVTRLALADALSVQLGIPKITPSKSSVDEGLLKGMNPSFFYTKGAVPLRRDEERGVLTVMMDDPLDFEVLADLEKAYGTKVEPVISGTGETARLLDEIFNPAR